MKSSVLLLTICFALMAALTLATERAQDPLAPAFARWIRAEGKTYSTEEFIDRWNTWRSNMQFISQHNAKKNKTFTVAMNKFGDLTGEEFARLYKGYRQEAKVLPKKEIHHGSAALSLPDAFDWRQKGAVTHVKNQGQCGSCWSFSATGSTEGTHFLDTGKLVSLSEQNLVDCSTSYGNYGCNGGLMDYAFQYIIDNHGIDTEESYPYTAQDGQCKYDSAKSGATLKSFKDVTSGDEKALLEAVSKQPVSVAIDASQSSFQFYSKGVYYEPQCSSTMLDHGVLAVGWGSENGQNYWIVKNSWGADWGNAGYIWMSKDRNNNCGIATAASYPLA